MNKKENHLLMYYYFLSLGIPFRGGRVSMWPKDNKYAYLPNFRFRFSEIEKDHIYYQKLSEVIKLFKGKLEWELSTKPYTKNFIIKPKIDIEGINNKLRHKLIDDAIFDVLYLVEYLKKNYEICVNE